MNKLLLTLLAIVLFSGCGESETKTEYNLRKQAECSEANLVWYDNPAGGNRCTTHFEKCTFVCERLFRKQAKTWANGSESQSRSANECVQMCLDNISQEK